MEDVQFSSGIHFAVGPLEPSNPTHGNSEEEDFLAQTILMTHTRLCAQEKHKQRDSFFFHRQSGGSRSGSPHSVPERMTHQDGFKALRVQRLLEPGFVRCPWRIDGSLTSDNAWDGMGVTHLMVDGSYKNGENGKRFAKETALFTTSKLCQCLIWSQQHVSIFNTYSTLNL